MTDDKQALRDFVASARALARKKNAKTIGDADKLRSDSQQANSQQSNNQQPGQSQDDSQEEDLVCCKGIVHIAYRGIADDRMYMSYSRQWNEIRFFRPHGLRVFCADCRHRVL
ncbi:MAG: hypothetical protein WCT03_05855 [Candidatus Obscuribacterales bacterium]|jgi:hypothetical protein